MDRWVDSDIPQMVKMISQHLYPHSFDSAAYARQQQETLYEFYKTGDTRNTETGKSKEILDWILSLDNQKIQKILTLDNGTLAEIVQDMSSYESDQTSRFGFALADFLQKDHYSYYIGSFFKAVKTPYDTFTAAQNEAESSFESLIRFCDKNQYCNIISFSPEVEIHNLLKLMKIISKEQLFLVPCRVFWDMGSSRWIWNYPAWYNARNFNTLSSFVCANLERTFWIHFWNASKSDPRVQGENRLYKKREICDFSTGIYKDLYLSMGKSKLAAIFSDSKMHKKIFMCER